MCTACGVTCDGLCQAANAKAPTKGLIDVSVIAPGTVVFFKNSKFTDTVTRGKVRMAKLDVVNSKYSVMYSISGYDYYLTLERLFLTPEEAFKA